MTRTTRTSLALLFITMVAMPGCIVGDIRDGIDSANSEIDRVEVSLAASNAGVERANELLESLDAQLAALQETNEMLAGLRSDLEVLATIATSLDKLDKHLASLRGTIANIDSTIPFLKFSEPEPEEETEAESVPEGPDTPSQEGSEAP